MPSLPAPEDAHMPHIQQQHVGAVFRRSASISKIIHVSQGIRNSTGGRAIDRASYAVFWLGAARLAEMGEFVCRQRAKNCVEALQGVEIVLRPSAAALQTKTAPCPPGSAGQAVDFRSFRGEPPRGPFR